MTQETLLIALMLAILAVQVVGIFLVMARRRDDGGVREALREGREESARSARDLREEVGSGQRAATDTMVRMLGEMGAAQKGQLESITRQFEGLTESNRQGLDRLRETIESRLRLLQESNEKRLDQMRRTVDEQLQGTLEKGLTEKFKLVQSHLEAVHKGLGEMRGLADGVGDLKRALTNVKTRGTWGETQLSALLEEMLAPDQFDRNVRVHPDRNETVEFAIRLPGRDDAPASCVWLPIDAKFPLEDYERLQEAAEAADPERVREASAGIARAVRRSAEEIRDRYLDPRFTTDFGIMFLPTEGLYAEVIRQPGLVERIQRECRVVIAGPTTFAALLNSLRVGFRTLAIQQRSSEVWRVLSAVKGEFGKFGDVLAKLHKQLEAAANTVEKTSRRTRVMNRRLREVEDLPAGESTERILGLAEDGLLEAVEEEGG